MNKIYGFGNAMIDIEIKIEEKNLLEINIEKGNMKHIDDSELKFLLNKYSNNIESRLPGGSIANSLYAADQNGASIHLSCSVGRDEYGDYFVSSFDNNENLTKDLNYQQVYVLSS
jgi:sugar/nucleoside kinase (ribokinase family)